MARVHRIEKARASKKDRLCIICREPIKVGEPYKWVRLYKQSKVFCCAKHSFRRSQLTGSDKLGRVYDAVDDLVDNIAEWDGQDAEELRSLMEQAGEDVREVAEEYRESAEAIREHFSESNTADECEERADELDSYADELEGVDFEEYEAKDEADDEETEEKRRVAWADEQRSAASEALDNCPV